MHVITNHTLARRDFVIPANSRPKPCIRTGAFYTGINGARDRQRISMVQVLPLRAQELPDTLDVRCPHREIRE